MCILLGVPFGYTNYVVLKAKLVDDEEPNVSWWIQDALHLILPVIVLVLYVSTSLKIRNGRGAIKRARNKFLALSFVFLLYCWLFLLDDILYRVEKTRAFGVKWITGFWMLMDWYGVIDSAILGNLFGLFCGVTKRLRETSSSSRAETFRPLKVRKRKKGRLFMTTFNVGDCRSVLSLNGNLESWIPLGYDFYAIGMSISLCSVGIGVTDDIDIEPRIFLMIVENLHIRRSARINYYLQHP